MTFYDEALHTMCFTNMASVCSIRSTFSCWWCSREQLHPHCYLIDAAAAEAAALSTNHVGLTETWPPGSCVCVFCRRHSRRTFPGWVSVFQPRSSEPWTCRYRWSPPARAPHRAGGWAACAHTHTCITHLSLRKSQNL